MVSDSNSMVDVNGKQMYNPGLIYLLREKVMTKSKELIKEGTALRMDITALEKERRHMHALLCDLVYFLEEDAKYHTDRINSILSTTMKSIFAEELDVDDDVIDESVPPKSALRKSSDSEKKNLGK